MIRAVPMINTARLTLRGMRPQDYARFAQIWSLTALARHTGGARWDRGRAWDAFLRNAGHWQMAGFGQWAVVDQRSREMIGQVGFLQGRSQFGDDFDPFPEAAWVLAPEARGQGLGAEAARAAHDWLDRIMPGPVVAEVGEHNAVALHLAERLGYAPLRRVTSDGVDTLLMRRDRPPSVS